MIKVKCSKCNQIYDLKESVRKLPCCSMEQPGVEEKKMVLTYSICPHCGHVHLSQLDDEMTQSMVKELHRLIRKKMLYESKGRQLKRKESRRALELDAQLTGTRIYLKQAYRGKRLKHNMKNKPISNEFVFNYSEPRIVEEEPSEQ